MDNPEPAPERGEPTCAHCGRQITVKLPDHTAGRVTYHGKCYAAAFPQENGNMPQGTYRGPEKEAMQATMDSLPRPQTVH